MRLLELNASLALSGHAVLHASENTVPSVEKQMSGSMQSLNAVDSIDVCMERFGVMRLFRIS